MKRFGLIALLAVFVSCCRAEPVRHARPQQQVQEQVHYNPPEYHHYNSEVEMKSDPVKPAASYGSPALVSAPAAGQGFNFLPTNSIFQAKSPQVVAPGAHQSFFYSPKDKSLYQVTKIQLAQHPTHGLPSALVPEQVVPLPLLATPVLTATAAPAQENNRPRYRSRPKYNFTFQIQTFNGGDDDCEEGEFVDNPEEYGENRNPNLTPQQITGYNRRKRQACGTSAERSRRAGNNPLTPLYGAPQAVQVKPAGAAYGAPPGYGLPAGVAVTPVPTFASYGLYSATATPVPALAFSGQASASVTPVPGYGLPAAAYVGTSKASAVAEGYPGAAYSVASKSSALVGGYPGKGVRPAVVHSYPVRGYGGAAAAANAAAPVVPVRVKPAYGAAVQQQGGYYDEFEAAGPGNALRRRPGGGRRRGYGVTGGAAGEI